MTVCSEEGKRNLISQKYAIMRITKSIPATTQQIINFILDDNILLTEGLAEGLDEGLPEGDLEGFKEGLSVGEDVGNFGSN